MQFYINNSFLNSCMLLLTGFLLLSQKLWAQQSTNEINTDRPDITESAVVVPYRYFQFEDGILLEYQKTYLDGNIVDIHNYTYSSLLARIGILDNIELRLGGDYLNQVERKNGISTSNYGFNNLLFGGKYQFLKKDFSGLDLGLLLQFFLPLGNKATKPKNIEPEFIFAYGRDLTGPLSVGINIGSHWNSDERIPVFLYSSSFGISISDNFDSFVEFYGDASKRRQANNNIDLGLAIRPINNFQIDVSAGNESFSNFKNWFVGTGASLRIP